MVDRAAVPDRRPDLLAADRYAVRDQGRGQHHDITGVDRKGQLQQLVRGQSKRHPLPDLIGTVSTGGGGGAVTW